MKPPRKSPIQSLLALSLGSLIAFSFPLVEKADAQTTKTWVGASGGSTATSGNWSPSGVPSGIDATTNWPGTSYSFIFNQAAGTRDVVVNTSSFNSYATANITFSGEGAYTLNPFNGANNDDRFWMGNGSTITQSSDADQTINSTILLNNDGYFVAATGAGDGSLTLNSVRFSAPAGATLYLERSVTIRDVSHAGPSNDRPGTLQVGNGATVTFSATNTQSFLELQLGMTGSGDTADTAIVDATHASGFTAAGTVLANDVTFQGNQQMTFSGNFTVRDNVNKTLTFTNTSAQGVTLSGTTLQFGAQNGSASRVVNLNVGTGARATLSGIISGSASTGTTGVTKSGDGLLTLSGNNIYTGSTLVTAGTLVIDGNQSAATGTVTVQNGATLAGSGTIGGATTIAGHHTPGNSPGIQNFASDLSYTNGSSVTWELIDNTDTDRGINFDGINVVGDLTITGTSTINLVFNLGGSDVLWSNTFWDTDQSWLFYDVAGSLSGAFALGSISLDSGGNSLSPTRGMFSITYQGSDVYLTYSAIPEPSTTLLLTGGLMALILFRRRR